ncbi:MAG: CBS domain-containing protein [Spirochaetales bacterium]|jgi:acetoin utilization protein AcuB|nr:CBS domain-containing protein [Spirochaetales bacterium]
MIVENRMTRNPVTVRQDVPVTEAQRLMRQEKIHRLPVLDRNRKLVGIVTEKDVLYASPSPASSLDVYEMTYLLSKLTVKHVMSTPVISIFPSAPIEEAARIMADNDIGGLSVVENDKLVGIITESDIFKMFIELFGARERGLRVSMLVPEDPGELAKLAGAVYENGGDIIAFGTFLGTDSSNVLCIMKVVGMEKEKLLQVLEPLVIEIEDVRET